MVNKCPVCREELGVYASDEPTMKREPHTWCVIDGTHYVIGDEDEEGSSDLRGFAGEKFVIRFHDGTIVTTTNLWCQGEISDYWKPKFPNNADFDWQWKKIGDNSYLIPK